MIQIQLRHWLELKKIKTLHRINVTVGLTFRCSTWSLQPNCPSLRTCDLAHCGVSICRTVSQADRRFLLLLPLLVPQASWSGGNPEDTQLCPPPGRKLYIFSIFPLQPGEKYKRWWERKVRMSESRKWDDFLWRKQQLRSSMLDVLCVYHRNQTHFIPESVNSGIQHFLKFRKKTSLELLKYKYNESKQHDNYENIPKQQEKNKTF